MFGRTQDRPNARPLFALDNTKRNKVDIPIICVLKAFELMISVLGLEITATL
jgi:hypothetical protein